MSLSIHLARLFSKYNWLGYFYFYEYIYLENIKKENAQRKKNKGKSH